MKETELLSHLDIKLVLSLKENGASMSLSKELSPGLRDEVLSELILATIHLQTARKKIKRKFLPK